MRREEARHDVFNVPSLKYTCRLTQQRNWPYQIRELKLKPVVKFIDSQQACQWKLKTHLAMCTTRYFILHLLQFF